MLVTRVSPQEAHRLMTEDGYRYVDVRSVPEFEAGHPEGAWNIPLVHLGPGGPRPNQKFVEVFGRTFEKDARIVLGCQSGGRSLQAASILQNAGFTNLVDQRAGFGGASGEAGWGEQGLPVSVESRAGRSWEDLSSKG